MKYRLYVAPLAVLAAIAFSTLANARDYNISYPDAPMPSPDNLVPPPQFERYFPMRSDGQAYVLDLDSTVNLTDALNRTKFDPVFRGERWAPFFSWLTGEKAVLLMSTYNEYDRFGMFNHLNFVHKFFERWSGFGPP